ncbi:MAG: PqqD family protein [Prevotella sp.]|nr:PqqD family protein [Prevotella sp.]
MKAKKGFNLRTVCGEQIVVAEGKENIDFTNIISMNESAAYLWRNIQGEDFNEETLAELLVSEYEVDRETALKDSKTLIRQWLDAGIIEA